MPRPRLFPARLRLALGVYRLAWYAALPLVLVYLLWRGRRDPAYRRHWRERFGAGQSMAGAVWVHAVSLGETRSAVPLIRALLERGERVVTTHLTPAGRRAATDAFGPEIAEGRLVARYMPMETAAAWRRLFREGTPKLGLLLEIEIWPIMIAEAARAGVPLFLINSQIPERSMPRARRLARLLGHPVTGVTGVLAKSERQAARFRELGAADVRVCGELRFDQPVPTHNTTAARDLRSAAGLAPRGVITLASVVEGEDDQYIAAMRSVAERARASGRDAPLFVYVPRAPERFAETGERLAAAGLRVARRSGHFGDDLSARDGTTDAIRDADVLLGDSMGEMYFYLALADLVVVGGGFVSKGAHNIIEPLALRRPVLVGPHVWTIEYPGREAEAAGVMEICPTPDALAERLSALIGDRAALGAITARTADFFGAHAGATTRTLTALAPHLDGGSDD